MGLFSVEPSSMPESNDYNTDIRVIAQNLLESNINVYINRFVTIINR